MSKRAKRKTSKIINKHKELRKSIDFIFMHSPSRLEAILFSMRMILMALCTRNHREDILNDIPRVDLLCYLACIEYTYAWLWWDQTAQQNLHAFCCNKYFPLNQENFMRQKGTYGANYNTIYKNQGRFECEHKMIIKQSAAENKIRIDIQANMDRYNNEESDTLFESAGENAQASDKYGKLHHFFYLWKLDRYNQQQLLILTLLFERKVLLGTASKKDGNNTLKDAYDRFYQIFKELSPDTTKLSNEEYVVTCFMAHELEYTYRFHLSAIVSNYMKEHNMPLSILTADSTLVNRAKNTWSRFAELPHFNTPVVTKRIFEYVSYDILNYHNEIKNILFNDSKEYYEEYLLEHYYNVSLVRNMIALLMSIKPPKELPAWSVTDYENMRNFFQNKYPLYKVYTQVPTDAGRNLNLGEVNRSKKDSCYDYIRAFQDLLIHMGDTEKYNPAAPGREEFVEALAEYRQLRYRKKQKSLLQKRILKS